MTGLSVATALEDQSFLFIFAASELKVFFRTANAERKF